jgi:SWI/SNF related-matrix-associated actin-dependent regulator of chromatin subfamily C
MFDDNWESVAEHVGSRTREECVLKFLQLEIEDKYLEDTPAANGTAGGVGASDLGYLSGGRLPFSQLDNPVMSVMGFLAGLADPATTAKAAGRSVEEMRRTLKSRIEREAAPGAEKDGSKEKETASADAVKDERAESMDVDDNTSLATREPQSGSSHDLPTTALSLTAARSAALASHTERQLTNQVSAAVNLQLQKLELKMQQFSEMEALLQAERREVERMRQRLFLDRLAFRRRVHEAEAKMAGLKIEVPAAEKMGAERGEGEIEPLGEESEGYMRHEI